MAKNRARLNLFGRQLLVARIRVNGWPVAQAADAAGVSRATVYKWLRRFEAEGEEGLLDRSSRPHRSPRQLSDEHVQAILRARVRRRYGPHRLAALTGHPRSTISKVLARTGFSRLRDSDRPSGVPIRYVHDHPGANGVGVRPDCHWHVGGLDWSEGHRCSLSHLLTLGGPGGPVPRRPSRRAR